jgi:hypothetical protein
VHDFIYSKRLFDRETCDAVFREALKAEGVPSWKAFSMWLGVRAFGGAHYG